MAEQSIVIGADHAGFELKEHLKAYLESQGMAVEDVGCYSADRCDYPEFAASLAHALEQGNASKGVLCCGSGIGMAIGANRFAGVRAVVCTDHFSAEMSRRHNNANVICFGARVLAKEYAQELLTVFLNTTFEGNHHEGRVKKLDTIMEKESSHHAIT